MPKHWEPEFQKQQWEEYMRHPVSRECEWSVWFRGQVTRQAVEKGIAMLQLMIKDWETNETPQAEPVDHERRPLEGEA